MRLPENFHYMVSVDYERGQNHDRHENCDSICRCSTIENVVVESINYDSIVYEVLKKKNLSPIKVPKRYG